MPLPVVDWIEDLDAASIVSLGTIIDFLSVNFCGLAQARTGYNGTSSISAVPSLSSRSSALDFRLWK